MPRFSTSIVLLLSVASFGCPTGADDGVAIDEATLVADDVCAAGNTEGECSLELRLLRAKELKAKAEEHAVVAAADVGAFEDGAAIATMSDSGSMEQDAAGTEQETEAKQPSTSFGPDAIGENMWTEATWGDIVEMFQSNVSAEDEVEDVAAGTTAGRRRSGAYGYSQPVCATETGGSCSVFSCSESRGASRCVHGQCLCEHGFCALHGFCYPASPSACMADTGGTCAVGSCKSSRGKTKCKHGHCLCKTGGCAWKGKCFPVTDTGGSCSIMGCSHSRGPTTCHRGRCLCQNGHVADQGHCVPYH